MGFRFRKSVKAGPFRINFSKSGVGWSVGGKGYRYTKKAKGGSRHTWSIPGTGVGYTKDTGSRKRSSSARKSTVTTRAAKSSANTQSVKNNSTQSIPTYTQPTKKSVKNMNTNYVQGNTNYSQSNIDPNQPRPVYNYAQESDFIAVTSQNQSCNLQWSVKDNSIFDKIAKWIDKTFFGSEYNPTTEKVMIVALCTNILGIYRIYAGRKIAAIMSWIFLLFSFITRDWMFLFTFPWFIIDLVRIYLGNYGRLKSNKKFDFKTFKTLIADKSRAQKQAVSSCASVIVITLICLLCPPTEKLPANPNIPTGTGIITTVSQSDSITVPSSIITEITTESPTTTDSISVFQENMVTENKPTIYKEQHTDIQKQVTTKKKITTTSKKQVTTKKKATTTKKKTTSVVPSDKNGQVWVTATGKKYHSNKNCSRMKNPSKITLANAKAKGYTPCKKCYG